MKKDSRKQPGLRNDRSIWLTVASILSGCALTSSVSGATMTFPGAAPATDIVASQLTDVAPLGPGWAGGSLDSGRDYFDNGGAPGQTFTLGTSVSVYAFTVLGGNDGGLGGAGTWDDGTRSLGIQIGSVGVGGAITPIAFESALFPSTPSFAGNNNFLTLTLATPVALSAGQLYAFTLVQPTGNYWYGIAHSDPSNGDAYAGGTSFNNNLSTVNDTLSPKFTLNGFVAPNGNGQDYVFAIQGVIPEPTSAALLGLGGLAMMWVRRRRT